MSAVKIDYYVNFVAFLSTHSISAAGYGYFRFHIMRLNRYIGAFMLVVLAAEVLTMAFIIYYIQSEIKKIIKQKTKYFEVRAMLS